MSKLLKSLMAMLMAFLLVAGAVGCNKNGVSTDAKKVSADPNKKNLVMLLTFDEDDADPYSARNAAIDGCSYVVESLRNDVSGNKFYQNPSPAYRTGGVSGEALSFDGYTTYIDCGNLVAGRSAFTINCWMAIRAYDFVDPTRNITPLAEYYDSWSDTGFIFGYTHHGRWGMRIKTATGWQEVWSDDYLDLFTWHNLCVTVGGDRVSLYYNGELIKSVSLAVSPFPDGANFNIGLNTYDQQGAVFKNNCFSGLIDEYKVYDKVLSADDVRAQFDLYAKEGAAPSLTYAEMAYPNDYLKDNVYRTTWHGGPPLNWVSDINGGFYYNGKYHIFYTKTDFGPTLGGETWGHMVSDDMVYWSEVQPAIWCEDNGIDNRWVFAGSGGVINNVPYIFYTGYIMSPANRFVCTVGMATPDDLTDPELTDWNKISEVQLRLPPTGYNTDEYRDPQIYIEDDTVFLIIVCKTDRGNPCIVAWSAPVDDILNWTFRGTVFEVDYSQYQGSGHMWEVPIFLKLQAPNGLTKYLLAFAPMGQISNDSIYYLGDFNAATCRFTPDRLSVERWDHGNDYFMCSGGEIYDPIKGETVVFELLQCCWNLTDYERYNSGYSGVLAMGRVYGLNNDGKVTVKPIDGYKKLHGKELAQIQQKLASETNDMQIGRSYHVNFTMDLFNEDYRAGFDILSNPSGTECASFYYDARYARFVLDILKTSNSSTKVANYLEYKLESGSKIEIDIYVDISCIEIFIDGQYAMSARAYNNLNCDYLKVIGDDWMIEDLTVYEMKSIY